MDSPSAIDSCAKRFEEALAEIIKLAELEEVVRNLAGTGEFHEIKEDKSDPGTEGRISR
jgi:vacuolar-type H+-ATPase subunit D/Vma8